MKKFSLFFKVLSVVLALAILVVSAPIASYAAESKIRFGVISDMHYFGNILKGNNCEAYQEYMSYTSRQFDEQNVLIDTALDGILSRAAAEGATYVLVPGDLTKDGELKSHQELAAILEQFELVLERSRVLVEVCEFPVKFSYGEFRREETRQKSRAA